MDKTMVSQSVPNLDKSIQDKIDQIRNEIGKAIIGQHQLIDRLLIGLLADGHLLLEGVPGIAKTLAANSLARTINCEFKRIQFTPDLLPADLIGTQIYNPKDGSFSIQKGPIFTNILLADEINRAPSKVQSALLEVMQEKQVTIGRETLKAPFPFLVLATQNPIEQEGTYPLSEAQTDRFMMKIKIDYPNINEEKEIVKRIGNLTIQPDIKPVLNVDDIVQLRKIVDDVYIDDKIIDYILKIVTSTRNPKVYNVPIEGLLDYGASPRASIALKNGAKALAVLEGRNFVSPQDIKQICPDVLRHRLRLSYEAEAENKTTDDIIQTILNHIPVP
ncbi:MAG: MoxR family ATPase [Parachlamydiaceae bacterium]|nr:MoxR family ATPase [Parachlamydiaceae bacterium]